MTTPRIHVGTSGFSYDDWLGLWYPPDLPKGRMFDYYAERFGALEINSTYYRIPPARMMGSLTSRGAGRVTFSVKFPQEITHKGELAEPVVKAFMRAITPALEENALGALLAQFPQSFHFNAQNRAYLTQTRAAFPALPLVFEMRHESWASPDGLDFIRERGISLCLTDMPGLPGLPEALAERTGPIIYLRLHGRNAQQWHLNEYEGARYDYAYEEGELAPWAATMRELSAGAAAAFVFFNNHPRANAPKNAAAMMELLGEPAPEGYTDMFSMP